MRDELSSQFRVFFWSEPSVPTAQINLFFLSERVLEQRREFV